MRADLPRQAPVRRGSDDEAPEETEVGVPRRAGRRRSAAGLSALAVAVVVLLVAGVVAGVLRQQGGADGPPALLGAPASGAFPDPLAPVLDSPGTSAPPGAGVVAALTPVVTDPALAGPAAVVLDAATGAVLASTRAAEAALPASTTKIVTGSAALAVLGEDARLRTRVVQGAPGDLVLVGGGDPTLTSLPAAPDAVGVQPARLGDLAARTAAAVTGPVRRIVVDASLFSGPTTAAGWKPSYVTSGNVSPVTALAVDAGRVAPDRRAREGDPPAAAGARFAALLTALGVPGDKVVVPGVAPAGAPVVAEVASPPISSLVEQMLLTSDNDLAEALARHVALATGLPGDFVSAGRALRDAAAGLGVPVAGVTLADGSGLSRDDRLTAATIAGLLRVATERDDLRSVLTGLPVAGWSGTLTDRYATDGSRSDPLAATASGDVRAKTGTLNGVSSLAGMTVDDDGRLLVFAVLADRLAPGGTGAAERALDRVAATLAACGCG